MKRALLGSLLLCLLSSCMSDFDPGARITGVRVVAARADQPFARPGETVRVDALVVDPSGRPFEIAWSVCPRPTSTTVTGCVRGLAGDVSTKPAGAPFTLTVPPNALDGAASVRDVFYGAVTIACPGRITRESGPEGLPVRCADASGAALPLGGYDLAVKRIFVRQKDRNANPEVARITFDGAPWPEGERRAVAACASADENRFDRCEGEEHAVAIDPKETSFESGIDELGARFDEQILAQYYATDGIFEYAVRDARTAPTRYKARAGSSGKSVTMWFVLRDDRGGATWETRTLDVR